MLIKNLIMSVFSIALMVSLNACDSSSHASLENAEKYYASKDYQSAIIELKTLLQQDPNEIDGRMLLGRVYLDLEMGAKAEKELLYAKSRGVIDDVILPLLANALLMQDKADDLIALETSGRLSPVSSAELKAYKGLALLARRDIERADTLISSAAASAPGSATTQFAQANLLAQKREFAEAKKAIAEAHKIEPDHGKAWSLLGDITMAEGAYSNAEAAFTKAMETRANSTADHVKRGLTRVGQGDLQGAEQDMQQLLKRSQKVPLVQYFAGVVLYLQQDYTAAADVLENAYSKASNHIGTLYLLASTHFELGNIDRALNIAESALAREPRFVPTRKLLGTIYLKQGLPELAESVLRPIVSSLPGDSQVKELLASSLIKQGRVEEATVLLQDVALEQQNSPGAQLRAGIGMLSSGLNDAGLETIQRAVELAPGNDAVNTLAVVTLMSTDRGADALKTAEAFAKQNSSSSKAHNLLGVAYLTNRQPKLARQAFEKALDLTPGDLVASENLATLSMIDKDTASARAYLKSALENSPNSSPRILYRLATVELTDRNSIEAKKYLQRALELDPDHLSSRLSLARLVLEEGNARQALSLLSNTSSRRPDVVLLQADAYIRSDLFSDAKLVLEELQSETSNLAEVPLRLALVYAELGDARQTAAALDRALQIQPGNPQAVLMKVRLLGLQRQFPEAETLLAGIELPADDIAVLEARYFLARARGDKKRELATTNSMFDKKPSTSTLLKLSSAYARTGNPERASALLEDWIASRPDDAAAIVALAAIKSRSGRQSEAIDALKRVIASDATNLQALNNLAWYLRESDPRQALLHARKAYQLAPTSKSVLDTYAEVLARNGEGEEAIRVINATISSDNDKSAGLRRAEILYLTGDHARAVREVAEIARGNVDDEVRDRANALLQSWEN